MSVSINKNIEVELINVCMYVYYLFIIIILFSSIKILLRPVITGYKPVLKYPRWALTANQTTVTVSMTG